MFPLSSPQEERAGERRPLLLNSPSPSLSPLMPRGEREKSSGGCLKSTSKSGTRDLLNVRGSMFDVCRFAYDRPQIRVPAIAEESRLPPRPRYESRLQEASSKHQRKLQVPMTKVQIPKKLQLPNSKLRRARLMHCLEIGVWDLFGVWGLGFGALPDH